MESPTQRLNVTLDGERAAKLSRLAARVDANPDPANVAALLGGIDGAYVVTIQDARSRTSEG